MKNIIIILSLIFIATVFSCSDDFFKYEPKGEPTSESFWKTKSDVVLATNALYNVFDQEESFGRGFMWYICASDDMITGRDKSSVALAHNFMDKGELGYLKDAWSYMWETIKYANDILRYVPDSPVAKEVKDRAMGEAYFMRSFCYLQLCMYWANDKAGMPIIDETTLPKDISNMPRVSSVVENYKSIIADFIKAEGLLKNVSTYNDADYGRAHKQAATAYIARTYLFLAEYDNSAYAKVVEYTNKVINSGENSLIDTDNPSEDYKSVFYIKNNWSSEYIWSVTSSAKYGIGSKLPGVMLENTGWGKYNGWGYFHPTNNLYEAFVPGDYRREATLLKFGDEFKYLGETRKYYSSNSRTGFQFNKYMEPFRSADAIGNTISSNPNGVQTNLNVPLMRFANVLLMKAEALIWQGKNGDVPLNKIRNRAGLSNLTNATKTDLKRERRCEFAGEYTDRHLDLVRWGDAKEVYSKPLYGRIHTSKSDPNSAYTVEEVWPARNFNPDINDVWPIPSIEVIKSNGIIKQNKGY